MELSVIIVTLNRPDCLRKCLEHLAMQDPLPSQIIVVDGSTDDRSRITALSFPGVKYLHNLQGYGHMTLSRNIGLAAAKGEIIAFIDDDAFVQSGWSRELLRPYADSTEIAGVGGRALNRIPGEETHGIDEIGKLHPNGRLTGNFAANPGKIIPVDHVIGCNMSFRRSILARLGGLRDEYPGTEVREETDICLRVRALGGELVFNPAAVVDHIGAGQSKGKRFDLRYEYYAKRNHTYLLLRNFGPFSGLLLRDLLRTLGETLYAAFHKCVAAAMRMICALAGVCAGLAKGITTWLRHGTDVVRKDSEGAQLAAALEGTPKKTHTSDNAEVEIAELDAMTGNAP
jgi:GT2 family glycosyltransferase